VYVLSLDLLAVNLSGMSLITLQYAAALRLDWLICSRRFVPVVSVVTCSVIVLSYCRIRIRIRRLLCVPQLGSHQTLSRSKQSIRSQRSGPLRPRIENRYPACTRSCRVTLQGSVSHPQTARFPPASTTKSRSE
jgi:hypothetical protein